jgi:hypothetical protein
MVVVPASRKPIAVVNWRIRLGSGGRVVPKIATKRAVSNAAERRFIVPLPTLSKEHATPGERRLQATRWQVKADAERYALPEEFQAIDVEAIRARI